MASTPHFSLASKRYFDEDKRRQGNTETPRIGRSARSQFDGGVLNGGAASSPQQGTGGGLLLRQSSTRQSKGASPVEEAHARERTVGVHGVAGNVDALVAMLRLECGHIVHVARSRVSLATVYITFASAQGAAAAAALQNTSVVEGQRFAVSVGVLPIDEDAASAVGLLHQDVTPNEPLALQGGRNFQRTGRAVSEQGVRGRRVAQTDGVNPPDQGSSSATTTSTTATGNAATSGRVFPSVRYSYLACLPFADRWLMPMLQGSTPSRGQHPVKRARDD